MRENFEKERIQIGKGEMATTYLWNGYAYKCFKEGYPKKWMAYEASIQRAISQTHLLVPHYYESEFPNSIKMDYIEGINRGERMQSEGYQNDLEDLLDLMAQIHKVRDIEIPLLKPTLLKEIEKADIEEVIKQQALRYIESIEDGRCLCHLDFHPSNVMYVDGHNYMIDWMTAKLGNPIYDYARTYVILYEIPYPLDTLYMNLLEQEQKIDMDILYKAILVMAVQRLNEHNNETIRRLIKDISHKLRGV